MEDLRAAVDMTARKVSLISLDKESHSKKINAKDAPVDYWYLAHIIFFFYGLGCMLPGPFLINAQDYWFYKFRNTSMDHVDNNHRTVLQANFVSSISITQIPGIFVSMLVARYGHKVDIRKRLACTMLMYIITFVVMIAFVHQDTDQWQIGFFIMTISLCTVIFSVQTVFTMAVTALLARFPRSYFKAELYGESLGGILSSTLQIIALTVGKESQSKAFIYFICGTVFLIVIITLVFLSRYVPTYVYYEGDIEADMQKDTLALKEYKSILSDIWPSVLISINATIGMGMSFPTIAGLVVSEYYGRGSAWNDTYFPIVITYLLTELWAIVAKFFGSPLITRTNAKWWLLANFVITYTLSPLYMFCNAQPRSNLPVLLPHDWEYILLHSVASLLGSYWLTVNTLSMKNLTKDVEAGYMISLSISLIIYSILAPLNSVYVNVL